MFSPYTRSRPTMLQAQTLNISIFMNAQKTESKTPSLPPYVWFEHRDGMRFPTTYVDPRRQVRSLLSLGNPLTQKLKRAAAIGIRGYPGQPAEFLMRWLSPKQMNAYTKQSERGGLGVELPRFAGADLATRQWVMAGLLRFRPEVYGSSDPSLPALLYKAAYVRYTRRRPDQVAALLRGGFDGGMATWWLDERYDAMTSALVRDGTDPDEPGGVPSYYEFRKQREWVRENDELYYTRAVLPGATPHYKVAWFSALLDVDSAWRRISASDTPHARARKDRRDDERRAFEDLVEFRSQAARAKHLEMQRSALAGQIPDADLIWGPVAPPHSCTWAPMYYQDALKSLWAGHPSGYDPQTPQTLHRLRLWERMTGQYAPVFSESSPAPVGFWEEYAQRLNPKTPKSPAPTPAETTEPSETHEPTPAESDQTANPETTEGAEDEITSE